MNIQKLMKQAQQAQAKMAKVQDELADEVVTASAGGGMVKVEMTGAMDVRSIAIDPAAVDPDDVELLQDMVTAAVNEAVRSARELADRKMAEATAGMNLPGLT
ncbi:MAG: YbaB/EbfC family nucleoid-associated protein [Coriobacteriales bacterium]|nr:YbaB/EbfC family nucleoid-associated protein [Coriobacteriales bacterium]